MEYKKGLTVKELKNIIKDWPDEDSNGTLNEVWIETGQNLSSIVYEVVKLNKFHGDILFISSAFNDSE